MQLETTTAYSGQPIRFAPALGPEHVRGATVYENRHSLAADLPTGAVGCEVGTQAGYFAGHLLRATRPEVLHLIDLDLSLLRPDEAGLAGAIAAGRVVLHQGDSAELLLSFPEQCFDWIYIDGDHSLIGARRDAAAAITRLKPDGTLIFNDYVKLSPLELTEYGVMEAVNELCIEQDLSIVALALHPLGYFDVAVRRRGASSVRIGSAAR